MSTLFSIGTSALLANQRALATTGHNIANANTPGYSRQEVSFAARHVAGSSLGQGVDIDSTRRYSDDFANQRLTDSSSQYEALQTSATLSRRLDAVLSDEDTGLAQPLRGFLSSVDALAADPASLQARSELISDAEALAGRFVQLQGAMDDISQELNGRVESSVGRINDLTDSIAKLNDEIAYNKGISGQSPNDLLDERDRLVNQLAQEIDVSTTRTNDGSLNVFAGNGQALVVGKDAQALDAVAGSNPLEPTRVFLGGGDITQQISGGELGGIRQFRQEVLDPANQRLQGLSDALAQQVNSQLAGGSDLNGNPGAALFDTSPQGAGLAVILNDPEQLAAAAAGSAPNSGDNSNILALGESLRGPVINGRSVQDENIALVSRIGSQTRSLEAAETAQGSLVSHHQSLRDQVSGVNLDEEAADLLRFQQAYQAAAQIISVADEMFQSLLAAAR